MIETYFLLPQQDNDGNPFTVAQKEALKERIIDSFGGLSIVENAIQGYWKDGDTLYKDSNDKYLVALESLTQITELLDLVKWLRKEFKQESIYLNVAGITEIIGE